ncbi:hypothetical protein A33M_3867 [Rhodovulum sp. PH10]|uniref:hypothetical protein n=1 Tax=Rhodovulum sp. PH10 TaxID=1187851 RepID=UPI00027C272E|nr:hypothetical protein [Rhodovulum sp. PH10]EJW13447.1 hypothetical protein A33M_3867 [Rhodovulum sp. PH10]
MLSRLLLRLHERLAFNAMARADYPRAERWFRRMLAHEGRSQRVLHNLALVRLARGDHAEAETLLCEEAERFGEQPAVLRALAEVGYLSGDREKALARISAALQHENCPDRALLTRRLALCEDATAHFRAMTGKHAFAEGNAYLARGDAAGALTAFRHAAEADPTDFVALNNLGTLLLDHAHDREAAARAFAKAAELSDQPVLKRNLAAARREQ